MKGALLVLMCATALTAVAQRGRHSVVNRLPYVVDTLHFYEQKIPMQRYDELELKSLLGEDDQTSHVSRALSNLQDALEQMKCCVIKNTEIAFSANAQPYLDEISSEDPAFDLSLYMAEYQFYKHYKPVQKQAAPSQPTGGERDELQWKRDIIKGEDPDVITEYDRGLALGYDARLAGITDDPARMAWEKIQEIELRERKRVADSVARSPDSVRSGYKGTQRAQLMVEKHKRLTKRFSSATARRLMNGDIWIGMTMEMVDSAFGGPDEVFRKKSADGTKIVWLLKGGAGPFQPIFDTRLTFRNEKVIEIDD